MNWQIVQREGKAYVIHQHFGGRISVLLKHASGDTVEIRVNQGVFTIERPRSAGRHPVATIRRRIKNGNGTPAVSVTTRVQHWANLLPGGRNVMQFPKLHFLLEHLNPCMPDMVVSQIAVALIAALGECQSAGKKRTPAIAQIAKTEANRHDSCVVNNWYFYDKDRQKAANEQRARVFSAKAKKVQERRKPKPPKVEFGIAGDPAKAYTEDKWAQYAAKMEAQQDALLV